MRVVFFKQKTAYEMRISDWSSDVCSSDLQPKQVGFYDLPGGGPHRFGVDNSRQLAFFPNDAPGWKERVIWTMDISDPLRPEVVSIWGLPWQKADGGDLGNNPKIGRAHV